MSGPKAGASPGYGLVLVAETTSGRMLCAEAGASLASGNPEARTPEDIGRQAAYALLEEVARGGVVDTAHQGLLLMLCALGPEEVNEIRLGPLTPYAVSTLRHIRDFLNVQFSIKPEADSETVFLSCIGSGLKNRSKAIQ